MQRSNVHLGGETPLLGVPIADQLQAVAERFPERDAVVSILQGARLSYGVLMERVDDLARALLALEFHRRHSVSARTSSLPRRVELDIRPPL